MQEGSAFDIRRRSAEIKCCGTGPRLEGKICCVGLTMDFTVFRMWFRGRSFLHGPWAQDLTDLPEAMG